GLDLHLVEGDGRSSVSRRNARRDAERTERALERLRRVVLVPAVGIGGGSLAEELQRGELVSGTRAGASDAHELAVRLLAVLLLVVFVFLVFLVPVLVF